MIQSYTNRFNICLYHHVSQHRNSLTTNSAQKYLYNSVISLTQANRYSLSMARLILIFV